MIFKTGRANQNTVRIREYGVRYLYSKLTYKKMMQNLFWATGYNIVAIPIAAGVLYAKGVMLNPAAPLVL